jgi:RNA polymerase sigma-70 factor, ECF subfamily
MTWTRREWIMERIQGSRSTAWSSNGSVPGSERNTANDRERDRRAVAAAKRGEWDAIHYLYVRYADDVFGYVQSIVRDHHEAEDITQNVFAKLITAIERYEERAVPFAAWIMRVARNATLDHLRARRQIPVEEVRTSDPGDERLEFERRQSLKEALAGLPEEQREVLVLRHVLGLSPPEIAERLGKTESSVHGLHHRGRAALKAALIELEATPASA